MVAILCVAIRDGNTTVIITSSFALVCNIASAFMN